MADINARLVAKASATAGEEPLASDLVVAELAINTADGKIFTKHTDNSIVTISGNSGGGGGSVNSVNGQSGDVVLDLGDMDDVEPPTKASITNYNTGDRVNQGGFDYSNLGSDGQLPGESGYVGAEDGENVYILPPSNDHGDGSYLESFFKSEERYDVVTMRVRSASSIGSGNYLPLGGNKQTNGSSIITPDSEKGWAFHMGKNSSFQLYGDGFVEFGTCPTLNADTWYQITYVCDWGAAVDRDSEPVISLWIDGAIVVNSAAPQIVGGGVVSKESTDSSRFNFYLASGSELYFNSSSRYYSSVRVLTTSNLPWNMTDTNIPDPVATIDAIPGEPLDGQILTWNQAAGYWRAEDPEPLESFVSTVNGQNGDVELGVYDLDDVAPPTIFYTWDEYQFEGSPGGYDYVAGTPNYLFLNELDESNIDMSTIFTDLPSSGALYLRNPGGDWETHSYSDKTDLTGYWRFEVNDILAGDITVGVGVLLDVSFVQPAPTLVDGMVLTWNAEFTRWQAEFTSSSGGGGATSINDLNDVNTVSPRPENGESLVWSEAENQWKPGVPITAWTLSFDNSNDYIFSGPGFAGTEVNPDLYLVRGQKYSITNPSTSNAMKIGSSPGFGGLPYDDELSTNNFSDDTLFWDVRMDTPPVLYYTNLSNSNVNGIIYVLEEPRENTSASWDITSNGSSDYAFEGPGFNGAQGGNPTIYLVRGQKYLFNNFMGQHPFQIQSTQGLGGNSYNDGITNNGVSNGTLEWDVFMNSPSELYYQCTVHASMNGIIKILDDAPEPLDSLIDVNSTISPTDGQVLTWNSGVSLWEPSDLRGSDVRLALGIGEYADDAAAGTGGVASGAIYYNTTSSDYRSKI